MAFKLCNLKYSHQFIIILLSSAAFLHNILMNGIYIEFIKFYFSQYFSQ